MALMQATSQTCILMQCVSLKYLTRTFYIRSPLKAQESEKWNRFLWKSFIPKLASVSLSSRRVWVWPWPTTTYPLKQTAVHWVGSACLQKGVYLWLRCAWNKQREFDAFISLDVSGALRCATRDWFIHFYSRFNCLQFFTAWSMPLPRHVSLSLLLDSYPLLHLDDWIDQNPWLFYYLHPHAIDRDVVVIYMCMASLRMLIWQADRSL
jgi:hypothetical protein